MRFVVLRARPILLAAVAASAAGAAILACVFLLGSIGHAVWHAQPALLIETVLGLPITLAAVFLGALILVALPVSVLFGILAHAIAGCRKAVSGLACAASGLGVGAVVWLALFVSAPLDMRIAAALLAGGIAGAAGGYAFAREFNRIASRPGFALRS